MTGHRAELLHHREVIAHDPVLADASLVDPIYVNVLHRKARALGNGHAPKGRPPVRAAPPVVANGDVAREELGVLIREYRPTVLVWLSQAMRAASPMAFSNMPPEQPNPFRSVGSAGSHLTAAGELARAIDLARSESTARTASTEALATPLDNPTVDHWRLAARAATRARIVSFEDP